MNPKHLPFLWLFFPLAFGIYSVDVWEINIQLSWMIFVVFFTLFFGLQFLYVPKKSPIYWINQALPFLLFFQIGQLLYQNDIPENHKYSIENVHLPGDKIIGSIVTVSETSGAFQKCEMEIKQVIQYRDTIPVKGRILVFIEDTTRFLKRKDICIFQTDLDSISNKNNPGEFDSRHFWKHKSINRVAFVSAEQFKVIGYEHWNFIDVFIGWRESFSKIIDQLLPISEESAVAKGLILGDRTSIDSETSRKFGNTGAMHVLAVSGLHVAILVQILTYILALFKKWISKKQALFFALVIVWIYSALTGFSPSVARSALMFSILAGSTLFEKNYIPLNSLAFSAILLLFINPHSLYDIGFQLSYLAMVGIFLFYQPLSKLFFTKWKWIQAAWEGTMVGIAAQIMTLPLTLYYFHQFPNYFILTNLGLMIFSFLVLALGIALFAFSWIPILSKVSAFLLLISLSAMLWIIDFVDGLPGSVSTAFVLSKWEVVLVFALIILTFLVLVKKKMTVLKSILFCSTCWVVLLVYNRFERMNTSQICFLNENNPTFIVQDKQQSFCFYENSLTDKKVKYVSEAYQKVYSGKIHYFELSQQKEISLNFADNKLLINKIKGGYLVQINERKILYATSFNQDETDPAYTTVVYAPWLDPQNTMYSLAKGSVQFDY